MIAIPKLRFATLPDTPVNSTDNPRMPKSVGDRRRASASPATNLQNCTPPRSRTPQTIPDFTSRLKLSLFVSSSLISFQFVQLSVYQSLSY